DTLDDHLRRLFPHARRVGAVVDRHVHALCPLPPPAPGANGPAVRLVEAPRGEAAKTREVLSELQDALLDLRREEPVVALGGGALLDVAGFAAATVRRGLPWIALPTTVLAMADAAVGGKVAVNHPRGKNLLGTFHPPRLVLADVSTLATLDPRETRAGLAEVYKAGRIGDADLLARLREGPPTTPRSWIDLIGRAVRVKARLVEADERDQGPRRVLNYGHTVGHALERLLGNERLRHGEAVAIGMAFAARLARLGGRATGSFVDAQDEDLGRLGLPTALPAGVVPGAVLEILALDKKRRPGAPHAFVLPRGEVGVEVVEDVGEAEIRAALEAMAS
ncbi:MAG: 3-dehydroquinate synthase family protein, partial [Planctomycetota bacterium]